MSDLTISNVMRMYQMDGGGHGLGDEVCDEPEWIDHFTRFSILSGSFEIPKPVMFKGYMVNEGFMRDDKIKMPCLMGSLIPFGDRYIEEGMEWVYAISSKTHIWADFEDLEVPSQKEYDKYFKRHVENMTFFIENKFHKGLGMELCRVRKGQKKR